MATRSLVIIAQVKDAASAALDKITGSFKKTGAAAKGTSINFTEFNRVLFSTTAFVGVFTRAFDRMVSGLNQSAELDRLSNQFEKVVGPKGTLFKAISSMTNSSIDRMEAMRSGISLQTLGITKDTRQLAEVIARSGVAAKRAGFNSAEGIKRVSAFLKDGSIANLSFLNVIAATNPALQAQMAILHKAGGVMGTVISTQAKLALGMSALRAATRGMENETRDLQDVMDDISQSFLLIRGEAGRFIGKALTPIIEKVKEFNFAGADLVERITKTDKTLLQTAKNFFIVGSAITAVIATLGTAKLMVKALSALGVGGIPFLAVSVLALAAAFTDVEKATESFTNMAKGAGAVLLGTFQLISSFINDSENFAKGIGKMDSELHAFLQKQGLLEFTKMLARTGATVITFTKDVGNTLVNWFKTAADFVDPLTKKLKMFFGESNPKAWARSWIEGGEGIRGKLVAITAGAIAAFGAFKALGLGRGLLAKLPVIGKLFGGSSFKGTGPDGSQKDPLHVKNADGFRNLGFFEQMKNRVVPPSYGPNEKVDLPIIGAVSKDLTNLARKAALAAAAIGGLAAAGFAGYKLGQVLDEVAGKWLDQNSLIMKMIDDKFAAEDRDLMSREYEKEELAIASNFKSRGSPVPRPEELRERAKMARDMGMEKYLNLMNQGSAIALKVPAAQGDPDKSAEQLARLQKAMVPRVTETGEVKLPSMPTNFAQQSDVISSVMTQVDEAAKTRMSTAMKAAMEGTSAGGEAITKEEWRDIMMQSLDESKLAKAAEKTANKSDKPIAAKTQRC